MRVFLAALLLLSITMPALAQDKPAAKSPVLAEADATKLEKLTLERQLIEERFERLKAQVQVIQTQLPQLQADWKLKNDALELAVSEAAKRSGVDPKEGWRPDVPTKT